MPSIYWEPWRFNVHLEILRACLVRLRVRMVSYAISYEKAVYNRPLRC
jgi:hypothetical protein